MNKKYSNHRKKQQKAGKKENIFKIEDDKTGTIAILKTTDIHFKLNIFKKFPDKL